MNWHWYDTAAFIFCWFVVPAGLLGMRAYFDWKWYRDFGGEKTAMSDGGDIFVTGKSEQEKSDYTSFSLGAPLFCVHCGHPLECLNLKGGEFVMFHRYVFQCPLAQKKFAMPMLSLKEAE